MWSHGRLHRPCHNFGTWLRQIIIFNSQASLPNPDATGARVWHVWHFASFPGHYLDSSSMSFVNSSSALASGMNFQQPMRSAS